MVHDERRIQDYRSLWVLLIMVAVLAAGVISSCGGGGGGGSDGEICDQCGDDPDGPCIPSFTIVPGDGQPQCTRPVDPSTGTCVVELTCRRKVDSGQRRCYPKAPGGADVDYQFRCDGSRPGGTPGPAATETPSPAPTSTVAQTCGNGIREGSEDCDQSDLSGESCVSQDCGTGILSCSVACTFNFSLCNGINCGL
jgi:hypothetical protein